MFSLADLVNVRAPESLMIKMDIQDLDVVAEAHLIAEQVALLFANDTALRSLVFDVTYFLLSNQYVRHDEDVDKVAGGTGIGWLHSGDVADACFYAMVERHVFNMTAAAQILEWWRFRDDMLFLAACMHLF